MYVAEGKRNEEPLTAMDRYGTAFELESSREPLCKHLIF